MVVAVDFKGSQSDGLHRASTEAGRGDFEPTIASLQDWKTPTVEPVRAHPLRDSPAACLILSSSRKSSLNLCSFSKFCTQGQQRNASGWNRVSDAGVQSSPTNSCRIAAMRIKEVPWSFLCWSVLFSVCWQSEQTSILAKLTALNATTYHHTFFETCHWLFLRYTLWRPAIIAFQCATSTWRKSPCTRRSFPAGTERLAHETTYFVLIKVTQGFVSVLIELWRDNANICS